DPIPPAPPDMGPPSARSFGSRGGGGGAGRFVGTHAGRVPASGREDSQRSLGVKRCEGASFRAWQPRRPLATSDGYPSARWPPRVCPDRRGALDVEHDGGVRPPAETSDATRRGAP